MWNYNQQKKHAELHSKTIIVMSFTACLVIGLVLLSTNSGLSANELQHTQAARLSQSDTPSLVPAKLTLQLEQFHLYVEQLLKDRHPGWIAGSARSIP